MTALKTVFKGRLLKVATATIRLPNGHTASFEIVQHPGAVLIVPFLDKDTIVLLRQFRPVIGKYLYELPAGTLDPGERPVVCAKRELIEETGYAAGRMRMIGAIYPVPGYSTEKITIFRACDLSKTVRDVQKDEVIRFQAIRREKIRRLFAHGKIPDAKTVCALSMCGWL